MDQGTNFSSLHHYKGTIRSLLHKNNGPSAIPIVESSPPPEPGKNFSLYAIAHASQELLHFSSDIFTQNMPDGVLFSHFSTFRCAFTLSNEPDSSFLFIEGQGLVEDMISCELLNKQIDIVKQSLLLTVEHPSIASCLLISSLHKKTSLPIRQELFKELVRKNKKEQALLLEEYQRFVLATDETFKTLRTPQHLLSLVLTHNFLKEGQSSSGREDKERQLLFKVFPAKLLFPFGSKDVLSLVVSLESLSSYERFDQKHMLHACKRCLPSLESIPQSFYSYSYAGESTISLYLELYKNDSSKITDAEIMFLKKELGRELTLAVEQVVTRIDIPPNEDDVLRNILLLSQEIKTVQSPPQVIIQFHGQSDSLVDFHVTLVRLLKKKDTFSSLPEASTTGHVHFLPLTSFYLDKHRNTHQKVCSTFLIRCEKEAFLRHDHSIDFLKAREAARHAIEETFGKIRDLNGGLIFQQNKLLERVKGLLTKEESKELFFVENLFHSLSPGIMKNLLGPEHILTVFRQLRVLQRLREKEILQGNQEPYLKEVYEKEIIFGFMCPPRFSKDDILELQKQFSLEKDELAIFQVGSDGHQFCFVICLSPQEKTRGDFITGLSLLLSEKQKKQENSSLLRISLPRPATVLDPRLGSDRTSSTIIKMLYEGLMRLGAQGIPTHAVAEEVRISDNEKTYTFFLRPSFWSNGKPVTAHDFEYAWKKILDPSFKTIFHHLFHPIKNARLVKEGTLPMDSLGVTSVSDSVLVVELENTTPHFLELCCLWIYSPLCKDVDTATPGWAYYGDRTYVCNGPFKLGKWCKHSSVQVVKNESYWDSLHVSLDGIDISIIENPIQALKLFEEGDLDWIGEPLSEIPASVMRQKKLPLHSQPMTAVQWYFLNTQKTPFFSPKVRQAFSCALDREAIIQECLYGDEKASTSVLPSSMSLLDSNEPLSFNPCLAKRLFEEGLTEQGLHLSSVRTIKMAIYDQEPHKSVARAIARFWEKTFGIFTIIDSMEWQEFFEKMSDKTYDVVACVWYSWFRDPLYSLEVLKHPTTPMNSSRWVHPEFCALIERASIAEKKDERASILKDAENLILQEMPIIPLFDYSSRYLKNEAVNHIYVSHMGTVDFRWASFDRESKDKERERSPVLQSNEIRLYLQTEPTSLDPRVGGNRFSQLLLQELFEGLTRRSRDGSIKLALAKAFSVSENGCVYTFTLRDALWSNGSLVTAYDFECTWKGLLDPKNGIHTAYAYTLFLIRNAQKAKNGLCPLDEVGIRAIDNSTLEVTLEHPASYFLELLSNPFFSPVPQKGVSSSSWATKIFPDFISNGPFILKERHFRSHIVLEKNPTYWNQADVIPHRLVFTILEDPKIAYSLFRTGELDWYGDPFGNISPELHQGKDLFSFSHQEADGVFWLSCRTSVYHLSSAKIRKALAMAINRKEICDALQDEAEPAYSLVLKTQSLLECDSLFENSNQESALQIFEEGLSDLKLTKKTFPSLVINYWDDPTVKTVVKIIQRQLKKVLGIDVEIAFQDWDTYIRKILLGDFQLIVACWFSWIHDPIYTLQHLKYVDNGINTTAWTSLEYTQALDRAEGSIDKKRRDASLLEAERLVLEELPLIPLFYKTFTYTKNPSISGENWSKNGLMELQWMKRQ